MRQLKWLIPVAWLIAAILLLAACGGDLQKPTGLEEQESEQTDAYEADDTALADETADRSSDQASALTDEDEETDEQAAVNDSDEEKDESSQETNEETSTASESRTSEKNNSSTNQKEVTKKDEGSQSTGSSSSSRAPPDSDTTKDDKKSKDSKKKKEEKQETSPPAEPKNTITISIVISDSEVPLPATEMEIEDGVSALDALIDVTMEHGVHLDYRGGTGAGGYVQGLGNVYEFDRGPGSGWMFRVNGIFPNRGAGVTPLLGDDRVEWLYTENLGEDIGADLQPFR